MVGVCVHWLYGPHTTDGVVGKDNPLLLASNFSGQWPGLVGLLNTAAEFHRVVASSNQFVGLVQYVIRQNSNGSSAVACYIIHLASRLFNKLGAYLVTQCFIVYIS